MPDAIVDACCFINLYATGDLRGFLAASAWRWHIPSAVLAESLFVRLQEDEDDWKPVPIESQKFLVDDLILLADIANSSETDLYVQLAGDLDDGEAMALAIAKCRSWTLATDDRKARRFADRHDVPVITTPELMQRWAAQANIRAETVRCLLDNIERCARFTPAEGAPGFEWWVDQLGR